MKWRNSASQKVDTKFYYDVFYVPKWVGEFIIALIYPQNEQFKIESTFFHLDHALGIKETLEFPDFSIARRVQYEI